jgi:predicted amidohydrolase YtcJ
LYADVILTNGVVVTFDQADSREEAVAIKGDLIIAVGKSEEISHYAGPNTRIIDLRGRLLTPGLIDAHIHVASGGPFSKYALDLSYPKVRSIADIVEAVKGRAKIASSPDEWIKGVGWDEALLAEKRYITRWDLDPVSPKNPVLLTHTSGHFVVVNSAALKVAEIDRSTPQPEGGTIVKEDNTGEPTGILKELASNLVEKHSPSWTVNQLKEGIRYLCQELVKVGVTSIKDGCTLEGLEREAVSAYSSLAKSGELKVRAYMLWQIKSVNELDEMKDYLSYQVGDRFKLGGIKIFMDGSLMGRTAWCYEEFVDPSKGGIDTGNRGYPVICKTEYERIVAKARSLGYQVSTHAIGGRAIDTVLDAYEKIDVGLDEENTYYTIIHASLATKDAIRRMKKLGVGVETQSSFLYFLSTAFARAITPDRMARIIPLKSFLDGGVIVGNGSDYFVAPFAPVYGIWAACTRKSIAGEEISKFLGNEERITVHEALRTYTSMAAKCLRFDKKIGTIEKGKLADLVLWADNLFEIPIEQIKDAKVAMTTVGGEVVYDNLASSS